MGGAETPVTRGAHLPLPFELTKQDEVGGRAREGGSAPNAGRVGDGDEEALPDVSAVLPFLLAVRQEIQGSFRLRAVFALNKPRKKAFRTQFRIPGLVGGALLGLGELSGLPRRQLGTGRENL